MTTEFTESRQYRVGLCKMKTGKIQALSSRSFETDSRVQMPGKNILLSSNGCFHFFGIVYKMHVPPLPLSMIHFYARACVPAIIQDIVIAFYQQEFNPREVIPPFLEQFHFAIGFAVKKISNSNDPGWFEMGDLVYQPLHIFQENFLWNGNAVFAKMTGLAQVQV